MAQPPVRNASHSRDIHQPWLEFERDLLFDIVEEHLMSSDVGGRWSKVKWEEVANTYSTLMAGTTQRAGERIAEHVWRSKLSQNGKEKIVINISRGEHLTGDRIAPTRNAAEIQSQIWGFPHRRIKEVIARAQEEDHRVQTASSLRKGNVRITAEPELDRSDDDNDQGTFSSSDDSSTPRGDETSLGEAERMAAQQAYAEEERQIALLTGHRQRALDRMGPNRLRGG